MCAHDGTSSNNSKVVLCADRTIDDFGADDPGSDDAEVVAKGSGHACDLLASGSLSSPAAIYAGGCEQVSGEGCSAVTGPHASLGSPLLRRDLVPLSGPIMVPPLQAGPIRIDSSPRSNKASKWICESSGRPGQWLCQPQHGRTRGRSQRSGAFLGGATVATGEGRGGFFTLGDAGRSRDGRRWRLWYGRRRRHEGRLQRGWSGWRAGGP
jgi:hypothetical protein